MLNQEKLKYIEHERIRREQKQAINLHMGESIE